MMFPSSARFLVLGLLLAAAVRPASGAPEANLVSNGDFEAPAAQSPPPGWVMWGATQYKDPANYTRDTVNPHGGQACFRIHHPANSAGYVVSAPELAIRPQKGKLYTLSFWARSDKATPAHFGLMAYESLQPFVDAPSAGAWRLDVGPEWRQFTFRVEDGWDFFAARSRYLLLTFYATRDSKEEKTLWVDDVVVTEAPGTHPGRMVDESALRYAPLEHRLRPGDRLEMTVDASKRLRRAPRDVGGVSFHRLAGWTGQPYNKQGDYTLLPELEQAIREMRLPMTRFYGVGDEPFGIEGGIDRAAEMSRRVNVSPDHLVLEFETQGASTKIAPEEWARGVRYSLSKGYRFRYWEIGNETYSSLWGEGGAFPTPESYIEHFNAVSAAVRQADPKGRIGVSVCPGNLPWGNYILKQAAGHYDFVVGHYYAPGDVYRRRFEATVLTENYRTLDKILRMNALIRAYNPGRDVIQYDTEWGVHSSGPNGERADYVNRNANIIGTLHRAVRLIYYLREGMLEGASSWQMFSSVTGPGFGILSQQAPEKRFLIYWLYYYFNRHAGEWVLPIEGTAPYYTPAPGDDPNAKPGEFAGPLTPAVATLSDDGKSLYVVAANGSWDRTVPCRMRLRGFRAASAEGVALSQPDLDSKALLERKEDAVAPFPVQAAGEEITCTLPAHSVVFVTLRR